MDNAPAPDEASPRTAFPPPPNFAPPGGPKLSAKPSGPKPLVLPRRVSALQRARDASEATAEARRFISDIFSQSRAPWGPSKGLSGSQIDELEKAVRGLEAKLADRDLAVTEAQTKLAERERELAETEALLAARERVIEAARNESSVSSGGAMSAEQGEALKKLKEELDRQEISLKEQRQALKEREEFLDQSEVTLFSKMQQQQEKETELEQKEEDLKRMARQLGLMKDEVQEPREKA